MSTHDNTIKPSLSEIVADYIKLSRNGRGFSEILELDAQLGRVTRLIRDLESNIHQILGDQSLATYSPADHGDMDNSFRCFQTENSDSRYYKKLIVSCLRKELASKQKMAKKLTHAKSNLTCLTHTGISTYYQWRTGDNANREIRALLAKEGYRQAVVNLR